MKIKVVKYGAYLHQRGATESTKCWDDKDTVEIDLEDMHFHCNVPDNIIAKITTYLTSKLIGK
jgi:hypothetical protein